MDICNQILMAIGMLIAPIYHVHALTAAPNLPTLLDVFLIKNERKWRKDFFYSENNPFGINGLTINQLKDELRGRGLRVGGNKPELLQRLADALAAKFLDDADEIDEDNGEAGVDEVVADQTDLETAEM